MQPHDPLDQLLGPQDRESATSTAAAESATRRASAGAVIGLGGQKVSANDRLYLLDGFPTLIVWGGRDHTIPVAHGRAAHAAGLG